MLSSQIPDELKLVAHPVGSGLSHVFRFPPLLCTLRTRQTRRVFALFARHFHAGPTSDGKSWAQFRKQFHVFH